MVYQEGKIGKITHQQKDHENSHEHQKTCVQQKRDIEIPQSAGSGSRHNTMYDSLVSLDFFDSWNFYR